MAAQKKVEIDTNNFRSTLAQATASFGIFTLSINAGFMTSATTIVIGALRAGNTAMTLSESQASWFGSLMCITQPIGSLTCGFFQDLLGRKLCLLLVDVPQLMAFLIVYFSSSVAHLYSAMVLFGLSFGFLDTPLVSYIGEATQPRLRGALSCFGSVFFNLGFMLGTWLGSVLSWRTMALWSALSPAVGFVIISLLPESPAWLVTKGRVREAERAYQWLRGWVSREAVRGELEDMINYVKETQGTKQLYRGDYKPMATTEDATAELVTGKFESLLEPAVLKAVRIVLIYNAIGLCASLSAMKPFFIDILNNLTLPISSYYIVGVCRVLHSLGAISMSAALKPLGKRGVTFLSLGLSIFCCLCLGLYLDSDISFPWVLVSLFALSYYGSSLGMTVVPWILTIELFPLRVRGVASAICGTSVYIFTFLITKTYYSMEAWLDVSGVCFLYGAVGVLGFVYLYLELPETEGVPLEEIERRMSVRRPRKEQETSNNGEILRREQD